MANLHNAEQVLEQERKYEFAKFKVKTTMDIEEVKRAVKDHDYEDARDNSDFLWDLICDWHDNRKMSDADYIDEYLDYIYDWEKEDGTNE
jgi:hypothetical protein